MSDIAGYVSRIERAIAEDAATELAAVWSQWSASSRHVNDLLGPYALKHATYPFHRAVALDSMDCVNSMLVTFGNYLATVPDHNGVTPVFHATALSSFDMLTKILALGGDVSLLSPNGESALHQSILSGSSSIQVTKLLLEAGADVHAVGTDSHTTHARAQQSSDAESAKVSPRASRARTLCLRAQTGGYWHVFGICAPLRSHRMYCSSSGSG